MLTFQTIKRKSIPIFKRNGVIKAGLFGSAARNKLGKKSDIDFLIQFKKGKNLLDLVRLKHELEDNFKRDVDLVTYKYINPLLKKKILEEEKRIL